MTRSRPYTLTAELTYRCPLRCPYCYNPVGDAAGEELATDEWLRVFAEAEALGVVQVHLTGGEPLVRPDLEALVAGAAHAGLYVNLITSGIPGTRERLHALAQAGLDHVQLSIQDTDPEPARRVAGADVLTGKLAFAEWTRAERLALTVNAVLHRHNLPRLDDFVALGERLGAHRLELANTQYHGWAAQNRAALLPTAEQLLWARERANAAKERLRGRMEVAFVLPDYYADWPKACMEGWGRRFLNITPDGRVLPCHAAHTIPNMTFENVRARPLAFIWSDSPSFNRFRGEDWMQEPCRSCERRALDFGGCRCQALALAGDAAATDPACQLSRDHGRIELARQEAESMQAVPPAFIYRGTLTTQHKPTCS